MSDSSSIIKIIKPEIKEYQKDSVCFASDSVIIITNIRNLTKSQSRQDEVQRGIREKINTEKTITSSEKEDEEVKPNETANKTARILAIAFMVVTAIIVIILIVGMIILYKIYRR